MDDPLPQYYPVVSGEHYLTAAGSSDRNWILGCRCGLMATSSGPTTAMRKLVESHKIKHLLGKHVDGYADNVDGSR